MSRTTSELLDQQVRATGVKKGHIVEQALRHHLRALQELPADAIVRPTPVVTRKSGREILKQIGKGKPTRALRQLAARLAPALPFARDDRTSFRSGDTDLDRYLHQFAGQNQFRHHLGVTYFAVEDGSFARLRPSLPRMSRSMICRSRTKPRQGSTV